MRHSFYRDIHKGIRLLLAELSTVSASTDFTDCDAFGRLAARAAEALDILAAHAEHESAFIGPLLQSARPDVHRPIERAHEGQEGEIDSLRDALAAIDCHGEDAPARGHAFVLELSRFTSEALAHMADEEEIVMPALWAAYDEPTLLETHQRLVGSIAPPELMATMRFMIPGMNHGERVAFFRGLSQGAPPPVIEALLGIARERLASDDLARLEATLQAA